MKASIPNEVQDVERSSDFIQALLPRAYSITKYGVGSRDKIGPEHDQLVTEVIPDANLLIEEIQFYFP